MTQAESLLAYFDSNQVKYELVEGRVKLTGARRVPAEVLARARQSREDIAKLLASRSKAPLSSYRPSQAEERKSQVEGRPLWQRLANERNLAAEGRGGCDRYCACQLLAQSQWRDRRTGKLYWICDDCLDPSAVSGPIILQRSYNSKQKAPPPAIELKHIERPVEQTRDQWWREPVQGCDGGRFIVHNMARDECVEIELRRDQP
jgi:hypothetical protein